MRVSVVSPYNRERIEKALKSRGFVVSPDPEIVFTCGGDGLVAATPYGSTAYYRSIGYAPFKSGIRIGFNNAWPRLPSAEIGKAALVRVVREEAWLIADNFFKTGMKRGDKVVIRPSKKIARFVVLD